MTAFALTTSGGPRLTAVSKTGNVFPGEGGEIPAVSSNGTQVGSAVVWATTRVASGQIFSLYAYDATNLNQTLFAGSVGTWLSMGDAFLTPTGAGGHVFVPGAGTGVAEFGLR